LPERQAESRTTVPLERLMSMPWLHDTLRQRMQAMFTTGQPFTLPGTKVPAAPWHVDRRLTHLPQVKSMKWMFRPPWIWAPSW
jgi:hypothetical protein